MRTLSLLSALTVGLLAGNISNIAYAAETDITPTSAHSLKIPLVSEDGTTTATATDGFTFRDEGIKNAALFTNENIPSIEELKQAYTVLTEPLAIETPFAIAGVTWQHGETLPEGAEISARTLEDNTWSPWFNLSVEDSGADIPTSRPGTEYMIAGNATGIQVRITQGNGDLPKDLRIDISYPDAGENEIDTDPDTTDTLPVLSSLDDPAQADTQTSSNQTTSGLPSLETLRQLGELSQATPLNPAYTSNNNILLSTANQHFAWSSISFSQAVNTTKANIHPRSDWSPNASLMTWTPQYAAFQGVIIHHTAGTNNYTQAQVPNIIRGIYNYHASTKGWGDIGYNVLIDKYGGRWEGRAGTLTSSPTQMVVGGHAQPRNTNTMGISVMGDYSSLTPSTTIINSIIDVAAWKFSEAGINPNSTSPLTIPTTSSTMKSSAGKALPRIVGHKDVNSTACPGKIYNYMSTIRTQVANKFNANSPSYTSINTYTSGSTTWTRLWGNSAFSTMKSIVDKGFTTTGKTVIIASTNSYIDALAANSLAGLSSAPILITSKNSLTAETKSALERLKPSKVIIVGGPVAVNEATATAIKNVTGKTPVRYYGQDGIATANAIAKAGKGSWNGTGIIVSSTNFQDGLSASSYSYAKHSPIFLANSKKVLDTSTITTMKNAGIKKVYIVGGTAAISADVATQLKNNGISVAQRIWGNTGIDTSYAFANFALSQGMSANNMGVATTNSYYDALAGGAFNGKNNSILVLASHNNVSAVQKIYKAKKSTIKNAYVYGGYRAISNYALRNMSQ
ncbi:MAG: cell wall-binding repeat-containing protein [Actinomycetaceae bacterium]|nr:cell wall-binding repeat-containing protein [Actinomycetaceae bacterium]